MVSWFVFKVCRSDMRFIVLWMLNVFGKGTYSPMIFDKKEANLYAGALLQFIIGLMVVGVLCSFIRACNVGESRLLLLYIFLFLWNYRSTWIYRIFLDLWYVLVGSCGNSTKLFLFMNVFTYWSYSCFCMTTIVFPLSTCVITELLFCNFCFICLIIFHSYLDCFEL
jgi:hypothetical protein